MQAVSAEKGLKETLGVENEKKIKRQKWMFTQARVSEEREPLSCANRNGAAVSPAANESSVFPTRSANGRAALQTLSQRYVSGQVMSQFVQENKDGSSSVK
ncbi:hypothetical protein F2P81_002989 [Scophthalmus maximus]|uniref:Uncharacterized protein n=1 Tax=Scophthalmus maximus TaxID=52904 RepID=A0A6A4TLY1_SCOMX|nr:hypothetical protein F2P81_002989 [Scophthalmus maximus]